MTKILAIAIYLAGVVGTGCWFDAMDARYGVKPAALNSWLATTSAAVAWPFMLPCMMIAVAAGGGGRWHMPPANTPQQVIDTEGK